MQTIHEFMCCEDPVGPMASGEVRSRPGRIALGADVALVAAADADLASLSACLPPVLSTVSSTETNAAVRLCDWSEESRKSNDDSCFVAELFCSSCNTEVGEVFFSTDNAPPANLPPSPAIDSVSVDVVCRPCDPPMAAMALSMNCADLRFKLHKIVFVTGDKNAIADEVGSAPSAHRNILRVDVEQVCIKSMLTRSIFVDTHAKPKQNAFYFNCRKSRPRCCKCAMRWVRTACGWAAERPIQRKRLANTSMCMK